MRLFATAAAFAILAAPAQAQDAKDVILWAEADGWQVASDPSMGYGCFITSDFEGGTFFRLGFETPSRLAYIMVGNPAWKSIEVGKDYEIIVQMDNESPWAATATGSSIGGSPMLYATTDKPKFVEEVRSKHGISLAFAGREIASLSLRGSSKAIVAMLECQMTVIEAMAASEPRRAPSGSDPFARDEPTPVSDPFAM